MANVIGHIYYVQTGGGRRRGIPTPFATSFIEDETAGLGALADIGCYSLVMRELESVKASRKYLKNTFGI